MYETEDLSLTFVARDENVWRVLDALAGSDRFTVVTSVTLEGLAAPVDRGRSRVAPMRTAAPGTSMPGAFFDMPFGTMPGMGAGPGMAAGPGMGVAPRSAESGRDAELPMMTHDERVVAGRDEQVRVSLELKVYRFCVDAEEAVAGKPADAEN